jgi:hypothetical protein
MSSVNKMGFGKLFTVGSGSLIYIMKCKSPKIDLGELHVLLFLILRKISQIILFQFFVLFLSDRT